jgi:NADH-quinone oxidoreductase subunit G
VCDKSGECKLQDYVHAEGRNHGRTLEPKRILGLHDFGGDILYDGDRCIMCTRCVRFMREIAGTGSLGVVQRGHRSVIDTFFDDGLEGEMWAGNIVDICPVGSLLSKDFLHKARVWDLDGAPSICPNCSQGCNIRIEVPLVRDGDRHNASNWQQSIVALVEHLKSLKGRGGVTAAASPFFGNEDIATLSRLAKVLGGGELVFRADEGEEVVCPGFPKLARRKDLAANVRGAQAFGFKRDTALNVRKTNVLIVVGDDLENAPANFGADADLFIYLGATLSPAARNAHFILPITTFAEQEGTFTNFEGRVQRFWPALQPPPLARPAWQILGVILAGLDDAPAPASAADAFARIGNWFDEFAGLNYDTIGVHGALLNEPVRIPAGKAGV